MELIKITSDQAQSFRQCQRLDNSIAKPMRKALWRTIKADHGLPADIKYRVAVDDPDAPEYCVIRDKNTDQFATKAASGMPYGVVSLAEALPHIAHQFNDRRSSLPQGAVDIGCGLFLRGDDLYFPIY